MNITVGLALVFVAVLLFFIGVRMRRQTGLPWVPVTYRDTGGHEPEKPLVARRLGLVGKPDYLLTIRGKTIPVEVKPGRFSARPYESDLMQLAAYCVLVEETTGTAPPYGLLRYAEQTFRLDYTPAIRDDVLVLIEEMRDTLDAVVCDRSHDDLARCQGCGFFQQCDQAMQ